jgi:hypothetical protein
VCSSDRWLPFAGASIGPDGVTTLTLTDGGAGDGDHVANGVIEDPGAPAIATTVPVMTVTPNSGLSTGDVVQVHGEGYAPYAKVYVSQCQWTNPAAEWFCQRRPGFDNPARSDPSQWGGVSVTADAGGVFNTPYTVLALLPTWDFNGTPPATPTTYDCLNAPSSAQGPCAIVVFNENGDVAGGNALSVPITFSAWPKSGFFKPVVNPPAVNKLKPGDTVQVKFGLGGDRGLDIFADGYPTSAVIACATNPEATGGDPIDFGGGPKGSLRYDKKSKQYSLEWKTDKAWGGTCRQLVLGFTDGTYMRANFEFEAPKPPKPPKPPKH